MNLLAHQLALDAHRKILNTGGMACRLGLAILPPDSGDLPGTGVKVGFVACSDPPLRLDELLRRTVRTSCAAGRTGRFVAAGTETIVTIAIDSGDAPKKLSDAIDRRVNAFLPVRDPERLPAIARSTGITALAMVHYASTIAGARALDRGIEERFGLETRFVL